MMIQSNSIHLKCTSGPSISSGPQTQTCWAETRPERGFALGAGCGLVTSSPLLPLLDANWNPATPPSSEDSLRAGLVDSPSFDYNEWIQKIMKSHVIEEMAPDLKFDQMGVLLEHISIFKY